MSSLPGMDRSKQALDQELASLVYEFSARHGQLKTGTDDNLKGQ